MWNLYNLEFGYGMFTSGALVGHYGWSAGELEETITYGLVCMVTYI